MITPELHLGYTAELTKLREFMIPQLVTQIIDRHQGHLSGSHLESWNPVKSYMIIDIFHMYMISYTISYTYDIIY